MLVGGIVVNTKVVLGTKLCCVPKGAFVKTTGLNLVEKANGVRVVVVVGLAVVEKKSINLNLNCGGIAFGSTDPSDRTAKPGG